MQTLQVLLSQVESKFQETQSAKDFFSDLMQYGHLESFLMQVLDGELTLEDALELAEEKI